MQIRREISRNSITFVFAEESRMRRSFYRHFFFLLKTFSRQIPWPKCTHLAARESRERNTGYAYEMSPSLPGANRFGKFSLFPGTSLDAGKYAFPETYSDRLSENVFSHILKFQLG